MTEILVVDDDRDVAQSIEMALRRHDFRVTLAYSGVEALKTLRRYRPSLVILDVMMRGAGTRAGSGMRCARGRSRAMLATSPIGPSSSVIQNQNRRTLSGA